MGCDQSKESVETADNGSAGKTAAAEMAVRKTGVDGTDRPKLGNREPSLGLLGVSGRKETTATSSTTTTTKREKDDASSKFDSAFMTKVARGAAHHVRNIFATPLDLILDNLDLHRLPSHEKSTEDRTLIEAALKRNFVFEHLSPREMNPLVLAFEEYSVPKDTEIIQQGDKGDNFYIIKKGSCSFVVNGEVVGKAETGFSFGELALLYNCPRAASVVALENCDLFRIGQKDFRYICQNETKKGSEEKLNLLKGVDFLKGLNDADLTKLANVMTPFMFKNGDYLVRKGDVGNEFYIIQEGTLKAIDISSGDVKYADVEVGPGMSVGEAALASGKPRAGSVVATSDGKAFKIDGKTFTEILGNISDLVLRSLDKTKLAGIQIFADSKLDARTMIYMAKLTSDKTFQAGETILKEGDMTEAALYLIRSGTVQRVDEKSTMRLPAGGYFGQETLLVDTKTKKAGRTDPSTIQAPYSVTVASDGGPCVCGVLTLKSLRTVLNTAALGTSNAGATQSFRVRNIDLADFVRHQVLGAGTFGQVWLVTYKHDEPKVPYALKIQSKYELIKDGQAKAVINEKNIMDELNHPFLCHLVSTYQDDGFVYMLMSLMQGGELYSVIHTKRRDGVPESQAKFYAACVADGLGHMHKRGYVYRDLKPENVMIDSEGYIVIVDFGFAKYVPDKTYTLCGTPLYLPPEIILNRGHNQAADHWSLGVLIYEMISGDTLFYKPGMEQIDLFRAIVKCRYDLGFDVQKDAADLITALVTKNPSQRLGSLQGGEDDILQHKWFSDIDFEKLVHKEIPPPFVPKVKNPLDSSNFEDWTGAEDKTQTKFPKLTAEQNKLFEAFT